MLRIIRQVSPPRDPEDEREKQSAAHKTRHNK